MSKLDVGVGEEFPLDDAADLDQERSRREWARRKQAFKDFWARAKAAARDCFREDWEDYKSRFRSRFWPYGLLLLVFGVMAFLPFVSALVAAAPSILGFVVIFWIYEKRHGRHDDSRRPTVIVTPPAQG